MHIYHQYHYPVGWVDSIKIGVLSVWRKKGGCRKEGQSEFLFPSPGAQVEFNFSFLRQVVYNQQSEACIALSTISFFSSLCLLSSPLSVARRNDFAASILSRKGAGGGKLNRQPLTQQGGGEEQRHLVNARTERADEGRVFFFVSKSLIYLLQKGRRRRVKEASPGCARLFETAEERFTTLSRRPKIFASS